jgi:DNA polymerase-1
VKCDVDLPLKLQELKLAPRDEKRVAELFARFGFKSWSKDVAGQSVEAPSPGPAESPRKPVPERSIEMLFTEADLKRWLEATETAALVSLDIETTSPDPMQAQLVGLAFCAVAGRAAYLPSRTCGAPPQLGSTRARDLKPWLEARREGSGRNVKYHEHVLANHGIALRASCTTLLESCVLESRMRPTWKASSRHLGAGDRLRRSDRNWRNASRSSSRRRAGRSVHTEGADLGLQIHALSADQAEAGLACTSIEMPVQVLFRMEREDVLIEARQLEAMSLSSAKCSRSSRRPIRRRASPSTSTRPSRSRKSCSSGRSSR